MAGWGFGFKPYYKWIIFNIFKEEYMKTDKYIGFKPYYKWIIFNITSVPRSDKAAIVF